MWNRIAQLASRQHGVVARSQLLELGCTSGQVGGLVRRGRLETEAHGTYAVAGTARTPLTPVMVAVLRAGRGARAAGERLLAASGIRDADVDGHFAVLLPPGRRTTAKGIDWRPDDWPHCGITATVQGIPSWSTTRNLLEAALDADSDDRVAVLADGVRRRSRRRMQDVTDLVVRHPAHPGARRLLLLGCLDDDAAESHGERLLEVVLRDLAPQRQVRVGRDRVDFLLPGLGVIVEYDGTDHESGRSRAADHERDERLRARGYAVVRVTGHDLRDPTALLARIHLAAACRA